MALKIDTNDVAAMDAYLQAMGSGIRASKNLSQAQRVIAADSNLLTEKMSNAKRAITQLKQQVEDGKEPSAETLQAIEDNLKPLHTMLSSGYFDESDSVEFDKLLNASYSLTKNSYNLTPFTTELTGDADLAAIEAETSGGERISGKGVNALSSGLSRTAPGTSSSSGLRARPNWSEFASSTDLRNWVRSAWTKGSQKTVEDTSGVSNFAGGFDNVGVSSTTTTTDSDVEDRRQQAIDMIMATSIPDELKAVYVAAIEAWDVDQVASVENILTTLEEIRTSTIDPRFEQIVALTKRELEDGINELNQKRAIELETEELNRQEAIRSARQSLESSGLTFSGEARRNLGDYSAFAQSGKSSVIPSFSSYIEGIIPQSSRLISSSSQLAYDSSLTSLGRSAESYLGSSYASSISGYTPTLSDYLGSIEQERQSALGDVLNSLIDQDLLNQSQGEYL